MIVALAPFRTLLQFAFRRNTPDNIVSHAALTHNYIITDFFLLHCTKLFLLIIITTKRRFDEYKMLRVFCPVSCEQYSAVLWAVSARLTINPQVHTNPLSPSHAATRYSVVSYLARARASAVIITTLKLSPGNGERARFIRDFSHTLACERTCGWVSAR